MSFSSNWFDKLAKDNFEHIIKPAFKDKKINYLEIGTYEGASLLYMFNEVLTHQESKATVIDPFENFNDCYNQFDIFKSNLTNYIGRTQIIKGYSQLELTKLDTNSYDIIYIDGDHTSSAVLTDAILSFSLLKHNGYMVFDDYLWLHDGDHVNVSLNDVRLQHPDNPHMGINEFLLKYKNSIEIIQSNWQMIIKKI
jgi:predicted O-methyltransferase YrrM